MAKRCCCCLTSILLVVVLIVGVLLGVGVWAYGKFAEPKIGLKFTDTMGLVTGLYSANEKKIVTNPYSAEDLDGFLSAFKKGIFVSEDTDITVKDIMEGLLPSNENSSSTSGDDGGKFADGTNETGNSALDELLEKVKFDFSSLENYDGSPHLLQITDRQLAALFNEVISQAADSVDAVKQLSDTIGVPLTDVLTLEQAFIDGADINNQQAAKISLTLRLKIKETVKAVLTKNGVGWLSFLSFLLPKEVFVTATVYPKNPAASAEIKINNYSDKQTENLATLVNNVTGSSNLFAQINDVVSDIMGKVEGYMPVYYVDSEIRTTPVTALLKALKIDGNVSETQFLGMIGNIKYVDTDSIISEKTDYSQYKASALDTVKAAYGIPSSTEVDVMNDGAALKDKINMALAVENDVSEVFVTDKQFAALVQDIFVKEEGIQSLKPVIARFALEQTGSDTVLALIVEIDFYSLLTDGKQLQPVVRNLLDAFLLTSVTDSEGHYLSQKFYMELDVKVSAPDYPSDIRINGMSPEDTAEFVNTLASIASSVGGTDLASSLNLEKISKTISDAITKTVDKLKTALSNENPLEFKHGGVKLPCIYDLMKGVLKLDVSAADIRTLMRGLYELDPVEQSLASESLLLDALVREERLDAFLSQLRSRYFLNSPINADTALEDISKLSANVSASTFDLKGADGLLNTKIPTADLKVLVGNAALAQLLNKSGITINSPMIASTEVTGAKTDEIGGKDYLLVTIRAKLIRSYDADGKPLAFANFKPSDIYITAKVDMSALDAATGENTYPVSVSLNVLDAAVMENFFKVINSMTGGTGGGLNLDSITDSVSKAVSDNMKKLKSNGALELKFVSGGILLPDVFELMRNVLFTSAEREQTQNVDGTEIKLLEVERFRAALQGMNDVSGYGSDITDETGAVVVPDRLMNADFSNPTEPVISTSPVYAEINDRYLAKLVDEQIKTADSLKNDVRFLQAIVASAAGSADVHKAFGTAGSPRDSVILTVELLLSDYQTPDSAVKDILPDKLYASLLFFKDGGASELKLNNLDKIGLATLQLIVNKIAGGAKNLNLDKTRADITDTVNQVVLIRQGAIAGAIPTANITVADIWSNPKVHFDDISSGAKGIGAIRIGLD